jgi:hypothetical protein
MTSLLDAGDFPTGEFAALYHWRWAQESYKRFKGRVEVENWSGKSALSIFQDFHAKVLALNLVLASTAQEIVDRHDDSHPKQVNMTHALRAMKDALCAMKDALCAMKDALVRLLTRANPSADPRQSCGVAASLDRDLGRHR